MATGKNIKNIFLRRSGFFLGAFLLFFVFNLSLIYSYLSPKQEVKSGSIANETVRSPKTVSFKSKIRTEEAQKKASEKVPKVYNFDSSAFLKQKNKTESFFADVEAQKGDVVALSSYLEKSMGLSQESSIFIFSMPSEEWNIFKNEMSVTINNIQQSEKIKDDEKMSSEVFENHFPENIITSHKAAVAEIANIILIPNYIYSEEGTRNEVEEVKSKVEPVSSLIVKDEIIITSGRVVSDEDIEKLEAIGFTKTNILDMKNLGYIFLSIVITLIVYIFFRYLYRPESVVFVSKVKALYVFIVFTLICSVFYEPLLGLKPIMAYLFPVSAPVILIYILTGFESAFFAAIILPLYLGAILAESVELFVIYFITSLISIYLLKSAKKIDDIFRIGFVLTIFNFIIATSFHLFAGSFSVKTISSLLGAAAIYGLGSVVIAIGTMLFWGKIFGITTIIELMELENPHQEILRDLSLKAPGTYHHSLMVANLSQRAAKKIGADAVLASVGGLYHDIGKIENPSIYIENQKRQNIHERIKNPEESARLIKDHVTQGVALAKKQKLPREIIHIIESHHGTSSVWFFLKMAKSENKNVDMKKFHYDGPLPKIKEAAIIMIADTLEAWSRSESRNISFGKIEKIVDSVIRNKIDTGQFAETSLSLKEIEIIRESFVISLGTMFHKRIDYKK